MLLMLKETLTVLIVTHVTHVERVESVLCIKWPLALPKYAVRAHNFFTHNFFDVQWIFNPQKF